MSWNRNNCPLLGKKSNFGCGANLSNKNVCATLAHSDFNGYVRNHSHFFGHDDNSLVSIRP